MPKHHFQYTRLLTGYLNLFLFLFLFLFSSFSLYSQEIGQIGIEATRGLITGRVYLSDSTVLNPDIPRPLYSFHCNGKYYSSADYPAIKTDSVFSQVFKNKLKVTFKIPKFSDPDWICGLSFSNTGNDTLRISNVVPYGEDRSSVYITGFGPPGPARAYLFRPGRRPVGVILPDNAWELGYSSFSAGNISVCALARRTGTEGALAERYETVLPPGAAVHYKIYNSLYSGEWQKGIQVMFREKYLFDLDSFDDSLYARSDLAWIRNSYLIILQMAWDREFYDSQTGRYTYPELLKNSIGEFGRVDVYGLSATWPGMGLDRRSQQDIYRDLPGGIPQLRSFVNLGRSYGTRFFIACNPGYKDTGKEDFVRGMTALVRDLDADGVIPETGTGGDGDYWMQTAADSIRSGLVMYPDGMAGVKEMQGIISGRVHNSIFLSPELNLSKFIKPEYAIFRVCDVGEDVLHREIAISFFNGYGTELNMFRPGGRNDDYKADKEFLAATTFLLRQNNDAFTDKNWTALIETSADNIFVNRWHSEGKTIYTVLNMRPEGHNGPLFEVSGREGYHYVSLWNNDNIVPGKINGKVYAGVKADAWPSAWAGTRREGSVDCIAEFPDILKSELKGGDSIIINSPGQGIITVWKGNPSYNTEKRALKLRGDTVISLRNLFGLFEGNIVIQLTENDILKDENVINVRGGRPWPLNRINKSAGALSVPPDMILVPESTFLFDVRTSDDFIPYPETGVRTVTVDTFLIDKYPVTNARYYEFISETGYRPADTTRYLRHWSSGIYRQGQDKYPVVYISYEDALAYAQWAGKRLPSEAEWQLAAQGTDMRKWPWGHEFHATYCNNAFERSTPVDAFPKGQSPYGVMDMVGNVWQMTNDMYFNGSNYFIIIRGGSFHMPETGSRYVSGGPQPLDRTQMMLRVSPGFERSETIGFRCVRDIDNKRFRTGK